MMTAYCLKSLRQFSLKLLLHSSNLLIVAHMEVKLGAHVYYIVSMTTTTTTSLRHFSLKLLLHSSNLLTVARMEVKLGAHVYYIVSMATTTTNSLRQFSLKNTSSLLKLAKVAHMEMKLVHMRITSFPWQLHVSMMTTYCSNSFRHFSSNLLTVARMEMKLGMHACYIISMTTSCFHDDHEQHQIASGTLHSSNLLTVALMEMKLGKNAWHRFHGNHIFEKQQIGSGIFTLQTC